MNLPTLARSSFLGATAIALSLFTLKAFALDPSLPPGGNFDLLGWSIDTPEADTDGDALRTNEAALNAGYTNSNYFYTAPDGGMVFKATNAGATTGNSSFTRSELREMLRRGDTSISTRNSDGTPNLNNWVFSSAPQSAQDAAGAVDGEMKATLRVNSVTTAGNASRLGRVIVAQIHARDDEPLRLYYRKLPGNTNGSIYAVHEPSGGSDIIYNIVGSASNSASNPSNGIELDELWSYEVVAVGNLLTVAIRSGDLSGPVIGTTSIDMSDSGYDVANDFMYFRAGAYNQNNTSDGGIASEFVQATFYALEVNHVLDGSPSPPPIPTTTVDIVNDSFADGDRTKTGMLDADWWSSSQTNGSNVEISPGELGLVTGSSGRGMHATFEPQTLEVGESIIATVSFTTPSTIGSTNTSFRIALMDLNNPGLMADLFSSSSTPNPLYVGQPGYFTAFDVSSSGGGSQDTEFRKHDVSATTGRFLGTTSEWNSINSSPDAGYAFQSNTDYVVVFSIMRTGNDSLQMSSSLSLTDGTLLDSHSTTDASQIANNFGMLGFWVNSNTFGSSNSAGNPNNGLTFTNVLVQRTEFSAGSALIDDFFDDGDRTRTGALDADWWSSSQTSGSSVEITPGELGLVTGTSGRGLHATFEPQNLEVGDNITVTYSFTTPATIGTNRSNALRIALMDFNNPGLAADLSSSSSSSNPLYVGQPGYFTSFDVDGTGGGGQDTELRKHDIASSIGRFLGTTSEWSSISSSDDAGYSFSPNTDYIGMLSITRTDEDSVELFSSLSLATGTLLDSHTDSDNSNIANNFGMLGFWVNSNTFGSSNSSGDADNGLTFTNVLIESTVGSESAVNIPVMPFGVLVLLGLSLIGMQFRARKN